MQWTDKEMICHRGSVPAICRPDKVGGVVGVKFYCHRCERYVHDDRWHVVQLREDLVPTLEELQGRMAYAYIDSLDLLAKYWREIGVRYRH